MTLTRAEGCTRKHNPTVVLNCAPHDPVWAHRRCTGTYTHPCGCQASCPCPGHRDGHALLADLEDHVVPNYLDAPFDPSPDNPTIPTLVSIPGTSIILGPPDPAASPVAADPMTLESINAALARLDTAADALAHLTLEQAAEVYAEAGARLLAAYDDDPAQPFHTLRVIRRGISRGRDVDALLCRWLLAHEPYGEQTVDGIGPVRVRRTQSAVRWDQRGTAFAYVEARLSETGEEVDWQTVVDWVLEAASVGYYRKTSLTAAGLDPQDFYTSEPGNPAVDLPKDA